MSSGDSIRKHLFSLTTRGIKYDLERMRLAVRRCGEAQEGYDSFHVAGTNGKGSVCAYLESALRQCGMKTGLFTSPHLIRFEERFMVNGRPIEEQLWIDVYEDLRNMIDELSLTFFEATTLMAFEIFRRQRVAWAVFETGLGGRLDATNVVVPKVSVISRVAMDHMEYLGSDLGSVALEKLGIVKPGVPLVMALPDQEWMKDLAAVHCNGLESGCVFVNGNDAQEVSIDAAGASFAWQGNRYRVNQIGPYQVTNALLALSALKAAGFTDDRSIAAGLEKTQLPGRFQVVQARGRTAVFDVSHNPDASQQFCEAAAIRFKGKSISCVLGIMKDKDFADMIPNYARIAMQIIVTAPKTERAARSEELLSRIPGDFTGEKQSLPNIISALEAAFNSPADVICIAGSFFTVGEAMEYLDINPY